MNLGAIWMAMLATAVSHISDPVKTAVKQTIVELDKKANATTNPWDNVLVTFLAGVLGIELENKEPK